ncbi:MAG: hypothetical protein QOF77_1664 [Solirubrobacteraceae bacterium]|nr:hypothetical protein [Solirubrobacteraceae bacterium]
MARTPPPPSELAEPAPPPPPPPADRELLPELARVHWRRLVDERELRRASGRWTACTVGHTVPFLGAAIGLMALQPLSAPVAAMAVAHAWVIPELYARRGANVVRPRPRAGAAAETRALGLLGDLLDHGARELFAATGLVLERGRLGVWLVGEAGALLVRGGGRRVHCYCVRVTDPGLPSGDRVAHLLLALRADERGFATVANLAFAGARWRVRRRLDPAMRPALAAAASTFGQPRSA